LTCVNHCAIKPARNGLKALFLSLKVFMTAENQEIVKHLNSTLKTTLTAINQYFLHARMMKHSGWMVLADYEYKKSIEQMGYADKLVERMLAIGGIPNLQELGKLAIGSDEREILRCDLSLEKTASEILQAAISAAFASNDAQSLELLQKMSAQSTSHTDFINTQLNLIDSNGLEPYLRAQV
jgi:bacterioferritin